MKTHPEKATVTASRNSPTLSFRKAEGLSGIHRTQRFRLKTCRNDAIADINNKVEKFLTASVYALLLLFAFAPASSAAPSSAIAVTATIEGPFTLSQSFFDIVGNPDYDPSAKDWHMLQGNAFFEETFFSGGWDTIVIAAGSIINLTIPGQYSGRITYAIHAKDGSGYYPNVWGHYFHFPGAGIAQGEWLHFISEGGTHYSFNVTTQALYSNRIPDGPFQLSDRFFSIVGEKYPVRGFNWYLESPDTETQSRAEGLVYMEEGARIRVAAAARVALTIPSQPAVTNLAVTYMIHSVNGRGFYPSWVWGPEILPAPQIGQSSGEWLHFRDEAGTSYSYHITTDTLYP